MANPYRAEEPVPQEHGGSLRHAAPHPHRTELKADFLQRYLECGNAEAARTEAGIPHRTLYQWLDEDPDFKRQRKLAERALVENAAGTMYQRGIHGTGMPAVISLLAWLKAHDPEHWVEKRQESLHLDVSIHVDEMIRGVNRARLEPAPPQPGTVVDGETRELPG